MGKFSISEYIRKWDQFSKNVGLTIEGDDKFRSVHGGFVTMVYLGYLVYYAVAQFIPFF
jgi:hypothetical protein